MVVVLIDKHFRLDSALSNGWLVVSTWGRAIWSIVWPVSLLRLKRNRLSVEMETISSKPSSPISTSGSARYDLFYDD